MNASPARTTIGSAGHHFFAMQYVAGESLANRLRREKRLPIADAVVVLRHCLAGLGAAHTAALIHRDIKPGNILLEGAGAGLPALVADFGPAKGRVPDYQPAP